VGEKGEGPESEAGAAEVVEGSRSSFSLGAVGANEQSQLPLLLESTRKRGTERIFCRKYQCVIVNLGAGAGPRQIAAHRVSGRPQERKLMLSRNSGLWIMMSHSASELSRMQFNACLLTVALAG